GVDLADVADQQALEPALALQPVERVRRISAQRPPELENAFDQSAELGPVPRIKLLSISPKSKINPRVEIALDARDCETAHSQREEPARRVRHEVHAPEKISQQAAHELAVALGERLAIEARHEASLDVAVIAKVDSLGRLGGERGVRRAPFKNFHLDGLPIEVGGAVRGRLRRPTGEKKLQSRDSDAVRPGAQPIEPDEAEGQGGVRGCGSFSFAQPEKRPGRSAPARPSACVPRRKGMLPVGAVTDPLQSASGELAFEHAEEYQPEPGPVER